jgi:hypothetical protein
MKKLLVLSALSLFSLSATAAFACDGMKDHRGSDTQAAAKGKAGGKDTKSKKDPAGEAAKS